MSEIPDSLEIAAIHSDLVTLEQLSSIAKTENLPKVNKDIQNGEERASNLLGSLKEFLDSIEELKQEPWAFHFM